MSTGSNSVILSVRDLRIYYKSIWGDYKSLDGVSFDMYKGEILGVAGESGSGKSTLAEGVLRLVKPPGYIKSGKVIFKGIDLLNLNEEELRRLRWKEIAYIPQGSMNALNPVLRVEEQMWDLLKTHIKSISKKEALEMIKTALRKAYLPEDIYRLYPHELSGGMKQRAIIAMAMLLRPSLIVADEPTTALDVVAQKTIIQGIRKLREEYDTSIIFISHDLALHAELVDRVMIMYAGKIFELGPVEDIFKDPLNPYTKLLISSVPSVRGKREVRGIPGIAPSPLNWPSGCRFHPRCPFAMPICSKVEPELTYIGNGRWVACHLYTSGER